MFTELAGLLDKPGVALSLNVVSLEGGRLAVTVLPKGDWKDKALGTGMTVQGTAQELDEGFAEQIGRYTNARKSLAEQVDATLQVLGAAEKEAKEKGASAVKKSAASAKSTMKSVSSESTSKDESQPVAESASDEVELF